MKEHQVEFDPAEVEVCVDALHKLTTGDFSAVGQHVLIQLGARMPELEKISDQVSEARAHF